jgi:hypothetical protein
VDGRVQENLGAAFSLQVSVRPAADNQIVFTMLSNSLRLETYMEHKIQYNMGVLA